MGGPVGLEYVITMVTSGEHVGLEVCGNHGHLWV